MNRRQKLQRRTSLDLERDYERGVALNATPLSDLAKIGRELSRRGRDDGRNNTTIIIIET